MKFRHQTITTPVVTPEDQILHGLTILTYALTDVPIDQLDAQLQAITALRDASVSWTSPDDTPAQIPVPAPDQTRQSIRVQRIMLKQPRIQHPIPPSQLQGCLTNLRRVSHLQGCAYHTTYWLHHLQGCTPNRLPQISPLHAAPGPKHEMHNHLSI